MLKIRLVHFLIYDHLTRGFNSTSSLDGLGKNFCKYPKSKWVDIPQNFRRGVRLSDNLHGDKSIVVSETWHNRAS